jgi:hypothetical protein
MIMFSIASLASSGENHFLFHSTKKWLTAADTRREMTEVLQEWFEQADNVLETAPAEDTDEDDTDDEDSNTDSDYNSVDAEQDVQEDDDDEGQPHPEPKVLPSYKWSHFFRGYIDTTWVVSQEAYHSRLGHDPQKFTGKQWASRLIKFQWQAAHEVWIQRCKGLHDKEDGILKAREMQELQAKTQANFRQTN